MSKKPSTKKPAPKKAPAKPAAAPKTSAKPAPANAKTDNAKTAKRDPAVCIKTGGAHSWTEDQDGEYCIECLDPKPKGKKAQPAKTEKTGDAPRSQLTAEENDKLVAARKAKATTPAAEPKAATKAQPKAAKQAKAKADAADKKLSAIDAAVQVLAGSKEPLNTKQMIEAMAAKGLWTSPGGKTPHATLYSAILREINEKGKDARFTKTERGRFTTNA